VDVRDETDAHGVTLGSAAGTSDEP
jgi:hypothetical protein